jgi:cystathionine beta-lyase
VLPLWVADMDFASPAPVIRALRERVEHSVFGYGIEPPELREVIVARLQRLYGWAVSPEAIVFIPGVIAGFNLACGAVATSGGGVPPYGGVLVQTPVYPPILTAPSNAGLTRGEMELTRQADGRYVVDLDLMAATISDRTNAFILCNPHNPVGRVFTRAELLQMAGLCLSRIPARGQRGLVIVSDEIHCDLVFSGHHHLPIASLAPEIAGRTITLMAPSKTFNVAGLGCAFAVIPDPELRRQFNAARRGLVPEVNVMGFVAALAAYRDGGPWLAECLRYLEANRDFLTRHIAAHLPGIAMSPLEGTYLAWLDCRQAGIPGNPAHFFLEQARVALSDGPTFGSGGAGFVRLNFGCPRATLEEALERMAGAMNLSAERKT